MADPVTLTIGAISALAFTKFLESSADEAAKKLTPAVLEKMEILRKTIWQKLRGIPEIDALNDTAEKGGSITKHQIQLLTPYLETAMKEDTVFEHNVRQQANEIHQEINIGEILGKNIQNVYGGSPIQLIEPKAPTFTGDINNSPINIDITY